MRVAAIDCGTNSIRLLVADVEGTKLLDLDRRMTIVRLGEGVDRTGEFSAAALERTFAACDEFAVVIRELGARRLRFVATSASRDARNRADFIAGVRDRLGVDPEVISGTEEAALSFTGAVRGLDPSLARRPTLVVDIGGGSTEFVVGSDAPIASISVDIGCVRMTERHLRADPPTPEEISSAQADIAAAVALASAAVDSPRAMSVIGVAGTVTTIAALAHGLPAYDPDRIHGCYVSRGEVDEITAALLRMPRDERAALPVMHPGRVDVIAGGAMILREVLAQAQAPGVVASEHDILDGIAWSLAVGP